MIKRGNNIEESIGKAVKKIAEDVIANCIISVTKIEEEAMEEIPSFIKVKITLFKQVKENVYQKIDYKTEIKKLEYGSIAPIKDLLGEAINKKYIDKGDRVILVQDESMGSGYKGMLFIFDIDEVFFQIATHKIAEESNSQIIESVINIATELAKEGREGRRVGTAFIIGERSEVSKYLRQLTINPFYGYSSNLFKVTDPHIKETIKEFSQLDGVFYIDNDGNLITAGAYVDIDTSKVDLPAGFGTKHRSCAALTKETNAVAIVVSESGGSVRVFKEGKITMKL
jgi:DNA integrity scanning protein DisA with diadenylate cyclase activity